MREIASFDVFDTVIVRIVTDPASVFMFVGSRLKSLGISISAHAFGVSRVAAETRARENRGQGEVTLDQIYDELAFSHDWSTESRLAVKQVELDTEAEFMRANPIARDWLREARSAGRQIVFVSDMYLPSSFLQSQLDRLGLRESGERLFVSCETGFTKSSGRQFQHMIRELNVRPNRVQHIGDNLGSDYILPKKMGCKANRCTEALPNKLERLLESLSSQTDGAASLMAGASRLTRLTRTHSSERERALWEVGAGVAGPILSCYVIWLLRIAQRQGIRRLYFVSRDGFLLLRIAERLAPVLYPSVELRYLYGSRQAWHMPAIEAFSSEHLEWLLDPAKGMTIRDILGRVSLVPEDVQEELEANGLPSSDWDLPLNSGQRNRLCSVFLQSKIKDRIEANSANHVKIVQDYLRQEGLYDDLNWAIVDLGWKARLLKSLAVLLRGSPRPAVGLYFALFSRPENCPPTQAFLGDASEQQGYVGKCNAAMMEMICTAPHGMTVGYAINNGTIVPELKNGESRIQNWGMEVVHESVQLYAENLVPILTMISSDCDLRPIATSLIQEWWNHPERNHVKVWGSFPYEDDQGGEKAVPIASPYSWIDCARMIKSKGKLLWRSRTEWAAGSYELTPPIRRFILSLIIGSFNRIKLIRSWWRKRAML